MRFIGAQCISIDIYIFKRGFFGTTHGVIQNDILSKMPVFIAMHCYHWFWNKGWLGHCFLSEAKYLKPVALVCKRNYIYTASQYGCQRNHIGLILLLTIAARLFSLHMLIMMYWIGLFNMAATDFISERQMLDPVFILRSVVYQQTQLLSGPMPLSCVNQSNALCYSNINEFSGDWLCFKLAFNIIILKWSYFQCNNIKNMWEL